MSKVVIIGGGVIGLAGAYYLRKEGHNVVVIDKGEPGSECSSGNMGWVCPSLSDPVPAPGLVKTSLKWMLKKDSPLYIKPSSVPSLSNWLYLFWKYCNEEAYKNGYKASLEISRNTLDLFDEIKQNGQLQFEEYQKGLLFVFLNESYIEDKFETYSLAEKIGLPTPIKKTKAEVLAMEPNLSDNVAGGLYLPAERHVRPESFTKALIDWLVSNGVEVYSYMEVSDFVLSENEVTAIKIDEQIIEGDQFLITTGAWTGKVLEKLNLNLPLTAGKGYSLTISSPSVQFSQPLYLGDSRVTISPFSDSVRIGGTMEMSGINRDLDYRRIEGLRKAANQYLNVPVTGEEKAWTGMRPMTPDGLPVLGKVPDIDNLFIATGHAMSGISMSLSTGSLMAELIGTGKASINLEPFAIERFSTILSKEEYKEKALKNKVYW